VERTQIVALIAGHLVAVKTNIWLRQKLDLNPATRRYESLEAAVRVAETLYDIAERRGKTRGA
jgi:hypothetical protein